MSETPDALVVFSAGTVAYEETGQTRWRTTTYDDRDAFGTLGGRDRVEAAALLAKKYPDAYLVTTSHCLGRVTPSLAQVYAGELRNLDVAPERIIEEENSTTTGTAVQQVVQLARWKGWRHLLFVSSEWHLQRVIAFYEQTKSDSAVEFVSSESVLIENNLSFATQFAEIKKTAEYQKRIASEARGLEALRAGTYRIAPPEDKRER